MPLLRPVPHWQIILFPFSTKTEIKPRYILKLFVKKGSMMIDWSSKTPDNSKRVHPGFPSAPWYCCPNSYTPHILQQHSVATPVQGEMHLIWACLWTCVSSISCCQQAPCKGGSWQVSRLSIEQVSRTCFISLACTYISDTGGSGTTHLAIKMDIGEGSFRW